MKYEKEVREIISQISKTKIPVNEVSEDANLYTIGIDSMEYIKIIVEIENKFNIKVPNMELIVEKSGSIKIYAA